MACTVEDYTVLEDSLGANGATLICQKLSNGASEVASSVSIDTLFLLLCGAIIFSMHTGFAMLCAGSLRIPHMNSILVHTTMDIGITAVVFYLFGFGIGFGEDHDTNGFMGDQAFALSGIGKKYGSWPMVFIQWVFCATATTIPHGSVAERVHLASVIGYCIFLPLFVYPVLAHWIWSETGWLSALNEDLFLDSGVIDAGGCTTVHMVGGLTGLMGALIMGPRLGRYNSSGAPVDLPGHSTSLVIYGALLLWFGWYCFNPVAILYIHTSTAALVVARSAITTTLGGAGGLLMGMITNYYITKKVEPGALCNGLLVGCVSTTASSPVIEPWAALLSGILASLLFDAVCSLWEKLRIDDPLGASPMHGACGAWGLIATGLFAKEDYVKEFYGRPPHEDTPHGLFYGGGAKLIGSQIVATIVTIVWVCSLTGIFFLVMNFFKCLRVTPQQEEEGLDQTSHNCRSYTEFQPSKEVIKVKPLLGGP